MATADVSTADGVRKLIAIMVAVPIVIALALAAFAWPTSELAPRDLPIGVSGPPQAIGAIEERLSAQEGAFDIHGYADEAAARDAIEDREVYGAIVAGPGGMTVLTASAASPLVAQLLQQAAGGQATVVDVVPPDPDDPRGAVLGSSVLPLSIAGLLAAVLLVLMSRPGLGQMGALVGASVLAGLTAVGIAQGWLGALSGDWWMNAGVLSLIVLAIGAAGAGLAAVIGRAGLGLSALLIMFVGNPLSGMTSAPEMLPQPWGAVGQAFPLGAGGTLLRNVAFFDGARSAVPLLVLGCWAVGGLVLIGVGAAMRRRQEVTRPVFDDSELQQQPAG